MCVFLINDFQHHLSCTKKSIGIIASNETEITNQLSLLHKLNLLYMYIFYSALLSVANHLSNKCGSELNVYYKNELNLLLLKLSARKYEILLWELFTDMHLSILLTLIVITF